MRSAFEIANDTNTGRSTAEAAVSESLSRIAEHDGNVGAFLSFDATNVEIASRTSVGCAGWVRTVIRLPVEAASQVELR